jgi:hypothetical protein
MIKIDNFITKFFNEDSEAMSTIVTLLDLDEIFDNDKFTEYLSGILNAYPILTQYIDCINNEYYWVDNVHFNINNQYLIKEEKTKRFDTYTEVLLNTPFLNKNKWFFTILNDTGQNKCRIVVKINHSYCDGYKLIDMLTLPFYSSYKKPIFNRHSGNIYNTLYYYIIGTISLLIMYISTTYTLYSPSSINYSTQPNHNIICGTINLKRIKKITKKNNVTINSFLHTLMVKTWYKYNNTNEVITASPIYIKNNLSTNNIFIIINKFYNDDMSNVLKKTNEIFNNYKFSLFILIANKIVNHMLSYVSMNIQQAIFNSTFNNIPLIFSNIIAPTLPNFKYKLRNIQFTTIAKNNITCFNIISFNNKININVSYRKGVITDKDRFLQCYKDSYRELLKL